jgi:hypothetical protein
MIQLVDYFKERYRIYEAKFSGMNADEQQALDDDLKLIKSILQRKDTLRYNSDFLDISKKNVLDGSKLNDDLEYGDVVYIRYIAPFNKKDKWTTKENDFGDASYGKSKYSEHPNEYEVLGIVDKFKRIHLQNESKGKIYIQWKQVNAGSYKKWSWTWTDPDKKVYKIRKSWKNHNGFEYCRTAQLTDGVYNLPMEGGVTATGSILDIFKVNAIKDKVQKDLDKLEAKKVKEIKDKEEAKKFWKERENYECMGIANGWDKIPDKVQKAFDNDPDIWSVEKGKCFRHYYSDMYKIWWAEDSSD